MSVKMTDCSQNVSLQIPSLKPSKILKVLGSLGFPEEIFTVLIVAIFFIVAIKTIKLLFKYCLF